MQQNPHDLTDDELAELPPIGTRDDSDPNGPYARSNMDAWDGPAGSNPWNREMSTIELRLGDQPQSFRSMVQAGYRSEAVVVEIKLPNGKILSGGISSDSERHDDEEMHVSITGVCQNPSDPTTGWRQLFEVRLKKRTGQIFVTYVAIAPDWKRLANKLTPLPAPWDDISQTNP